jgi:2-polyprenyl-3-methyl-5-hydroxy-6-metoxy-1,4-benzoquinol methylase
MPQSNNTFPSSNFKKHTSSKGIRRTLINRFDKILISSIKNLDDTQAGNFLDVGCGEGFTLALLHEEMPHWNLCGFDINEDALDIAREKIPGSTCVCGDIYNIPFENKRFDMVLCSEVLEHLRNPDAALEQIKQKCKKHVILSVPHEPFFQIANFLSGKYFRTLGNHPEHIQHFSKRSFGRLCDKFFNRIKLTAVFPWIMYIGNVQ